MAQSDSKRYKSDYPLLHDTGWLDVMLRHQGVDASEFALRFSGRKDWPVREIAEQLHCYPRAEVKLGALHRPGMIYLREALEQASGYATATWRARNWVTNGEKSKRSAISTDDANSGSRLQENPDSSSKPDRTFRVADLTGGLGIDTAAFVLAGAEVAYCERNPKLTAIARHNHELLGLDTRICWHTGDSMEWLATRKQGAIQQNSIQQNCSDPECNRKNSIQQEASQEKASQPRGSHSVDSHSETLKLDLLYIDPSRRSGGRRVHSLQDSEPDITRYLTLFRSAAHRYLIKLSPMMDPVDAARALEDCISVTAVSVDGELKELLADCIPPQDQSSATPRPDPVLRAVMVDTSGNERFRFSSESAEDGSGGQMESLRPSRSPEPQSGTSPNTESQSGTSPNTEPQSGTTPNPGTQPSPACDPHYMLSGSLLFEPDPALYKMRLIDEAVRRYGLDRIHPEIGYLTGPDTAPEMFPGKVYRIRRTLPFKPRALRKWLVDNGLTRVHIHQRGFPLTVDQLYSKLGCRMGEEAHLFATLSGDGQKVLIVADRTG